MSPKFATEIQNHRKPLGHFLFPGKKIKYNLSFNDHTVEVLVGKLYMAFPHAFIHGKEGVASSGMSKTEQSQ